MSEILGCLQINTDLEDAVLLSKAPSQATPLKEECES